MKKITALLLFLTAGVFSFAQMQTESIAIFKNGQSFVTKKGDVAAIDGKYMMQENLPSALFGTLWFSAPDGKIKSLVSYRDSIENKKSKLRFSRIDLLKSNVGKEVVFYLKATGGNENGAFMKGFLRYIDCEARGECTVILENEKKTFVFGTEDVMRFKFENGINIPAPKKSLAPVIEVAFTDQNATQNLQMMYLQNGLSWTPQYLLRLQDEKTAALTMQAVIVNNTEDIDNVPLDLVIGVPNFKYATGLENFLNFAGNTSLPGRNNTAFPNSFSNVAAQQITYGIDAAPTADFSAGTGAEGSENEDLYFYRLPNFSLRKDGRAMHNIFSDEVKIQHLYETNLNGNVENANSYQPEFLFSANRQNPVFHVVKLENTTQNPWTTAPILVMNEKNGTARPLSQDILNYTAKGSNGFVKLTETPEVKIKHAEKRIDLTPNALKRYGYNYALVKVAGQLTVKSFKNKKIDLNVRRQIIGNLLKSDKEWLKAEMLNTSNTPNRKTNVCWELEVKAGEEVTVDYEYEIYLRK